MAVETGRKSSRAQSRYHHGDLRRALIDATFSVIRSSGLDAVTMRNVATEAGVSEAAPYHHFRDKTELLASAAAIAFDALTARMQAARDGEACDPRRALVCVGVAWVRFALEDVGAFRLLFGAHTDELVAFPDARRAGRAAKALVRSVVLEYVQRAGACADPETLFRSLWAQVHGIAWLALEREYGARFGKNDALALAEEAVGRLLDGFGSTNQRPA